MTTPAGWYPDPQDPGSGRARYWDGAAWTSSVIDPGLAAGPAYGAGYPPVPGYGGPPADHFGFGESIRRAFGKYATFAGRATVAEYWWFWLFEMLIVGVLYVVLLVAVFTGTQTTETTDADGLPVTTSTVATANATIALIVGVLLLVVALALLLPAISVAVRRLHDTNKSGWWYWISLVPLIGGIWLLVLMISSGDPGPNMYGPPSTHAT